MKRFVLIIKFCTKRNISTFCLSVNSFDPCNKSCSSTVIRVDNCVTESIKSRRRFPYNGQNSKKLLVVSTEPQRQFSESDKFLTNKWEFKELELMRKRACNI